MTREAFIRKWLGRIFPYDDHHRDLMRDDLDKVISNQTPPPDQRDKIIADNPISVLYTNAIKYCSTDGLNILIGMLNEFINNDAEHSQDVMANVTDGKHEPMKSIALPEYNEILYHAKVCSELEFREYWNEIQREAMQLYANQFKKGEIE